MLHTCNACMQCMHVDKPTAFGSIPRRARRTIDMATTPAISPLPRINSTTERDLLVAQQRRFDFSDEVSQMMYNLCGIVVVTNGKTYRAPDNDVAVALDKASNYFVISKMSVKEWLVGFVSTKKLCIKALAETILNTERLSGGFLSTDLCGEKEGACQENAEPRATPIENAEHACVVLQNLLGHMKDYGAVWEENRSLRAYVRAKSGCDKQRKRVQSLERRKDLYLQKCEMEDKLQQQEDNRRFQEMVQQEQARLAQRDFDLRQKRTAELQAIEQELRRAEEKESSRKQQEDDAISEIRGRPEKVHRHQSQEHEEFLRGLLELMKKTVSGVREK